MKDLTQGSMYKNFFLFSIPIVLSSLLSSAFGIINTSIAGLFLGAEGLAATNASTSFILIVEAIFFGHAYGLSVYAANLFGGKEYDKLKRVLYANVFLTLASASLLALISIVFSTPILHFLNVEELIFEEARQYFCLICIQMIVSMGSHMLVTCCHSMGETTFPLIMSFLSAGLTVLGNVLTVAVFKLGVFGMGVSTIVVSTLIFLCYWLRFRGYFRRLGVGTRIPRFSWRDVRGILSYSLPNIFQQSSLYVTSLLYAPVQNGLGYLAVAAISVASRIQSLHSTLYYSASKTAGNYLAQCIGAKKHHKIRKAVVAALLQGFFFFLCMFIPVFLFPDLVASLFLDKSAEPVVFDYVTRYIRIYLPFLSLHVFCGIFHSILRGVNSSAHLILTSLLGAIGKMVFAMILAPILGVDGIFLAAVLGWALEGIYVLVLCLTGRWVPYEMRHLILPRKKKKKTGASTLSATEEVSP